LREEGKPVGYFDGLIAAIALGYDGEIVTCIHHFDSIPGLQVRRYKEVLCLNPVDRVLEVNIDPLRGELPG